MSRRSRCTVVRATPMTWRDFDDDTAPAIEEFVEWFTSLAPFNQTVLRGQIAALRQLAANGEIDFGDDEMLKPVSFPDIYELKWTFLTTKIRQYHGEPGSQPDDLIRLHMHIKKHVDGDYEAEKALQSQEISQAALRYAGGVSSNWGISS